MRLTPTGGQNPSQLPLSYLKKRADFVRAAKRGHKWVASGLIVQFLPAPSESAGPDYIPELRFGITASRKVGNAVKRNRVKRQLRAALQESLAEMALKAGDYVIIARPHAHDVGYAILKRDLCYCLRKLQKPKSSPRSKHS